MSGMRFPKKYISFLLYVCLAFFVSECSRHSATQTRPKPVKTKASALWSLNNSRIKQFRKRYASGKYVQTCLLRAKQQGHLKYIHRVFYKNKLPPELSLLPILESCFDPKADSGHARGLWQFTKATAKDYRLKIGWFSDDRLNWKKSTHAAAKYLAILGKRFDRDWALALVSYNGGPGYISRQMKRQRTRSFWKLKLRQESYEYVPKFVAMLQIARRKYPDLYYQGGPRAWKNRG